MIPELTYAIIGCSVLLALVSLVLAVRNRAAGRWTLVGTGLVMMLLLIQTVVSVILWGQSPSTDGILFFGYLLTALLLVPLAGAWAYAELTRWGPAVLAAASATVAVMLERMNQIWM